MIQAPIVFLSILPAPFLWPAKAGLLIMDHASLFTETVHCYLPKLCILICRNCVSLIADFCVLLFTDHTDTKNEHILNEIKQLYSKSSLINVNPYLYDYKREGEKLIPISLAIKIMKDAKNYPRVIASLAEKSCRIQANKELIPVGETAKSEKWFSN